MAMEDIDDDFLSQVASLEAQALLTSASKRRKLATSSPPPEEGVYTAVLRGSRSLLFHHLSASTHTPLASGGGKAGHWPRDCGSGGEVAEKTCPCGVGVCLALTANTERNRGRKFYKCPLREENGGCGFFEWCDKNTEAAPITVKTQSYASNTGGLCVGGDDVAEKACPCGVGVCVALTANTEKNRGRKFYKCPLREENGGCGFFEWCDKNTEAEPKTVKSESYVSNTSASDLSCPCGAGACLMLTAKTGKNIGQQFYRCPANQAMSCGFFKWCHEHKTSGDTLSYSANASTTYKTNTTSQHSFPKDNGSSCFKCGMDGHWARDCTFSVNASTTYTPGKTNQKIFANSSGSSCYKCGKDGHWAKDCC